MKLLLPLLILLNFAGGVPAYFELQRLDSLAETIFSIVKPKLGSLEAEICCHKPQLAWALDSKWVQLPPDSIIEHCHSDSVKFIFISGQEFSVRPILRQILNSRSYLPRYKISQLDPYFLLLEYNPPPFYLP